MGELVQGRVASFFRHECNEVGMDGKKKGAGIAEESPNLKVGALIYATVVAAFPFWVREDADTLRDCAYRIQRSLCEEVN